jgi:prepilin-type N-terminal cleavage/methylation domain-containing protein
MKLHRSSAFTLIELSIALVIIGLLIGGILVGRDLIQAAKIRRTIQQVEQVTLAVHTFKGRYKCLPGDCRNATSYGLTQDCNGLASGCGNGVIEGNFLYLPLYKETMDFWSQLSEAKLIANNYPYGAYLDPTAPGLNYPSLALNERVGIWVSGPISGASAGAPNQYWLLNADAVNSTYRGILNPLENYLIDSKIDDGMPDTGQSRAATWWSTVVLTAGSGDPSACAAGGNCCLVNSAPRVYNVTNTSGFDNYPLGSTLCALRILAGF